MNAKTWKAWLAPGGLLLGLVAAMVNSPVFALVAPSLGFYYVAAFAAGLLLAWRFHSSRILFGLLTLLLAHRAVEFFSGGRAGTGPGHMAITLAAVLVPLNFLGFAVMRERGLVLAGVAPRAAILFLESVAFAVLCRPENNAAVPTRPQVGELPVWALIGFVVAARIYNRRFHGTPFPVVPVDVADKGDLYVWL